jgi:hypothetical protein
MQCHSRKVWYSTWIPGPRRPGDAESPGNNSQAGGDLRNVELVACPVECARFGDPDECLDATESAPGGLRRDVATVTVKDGADSIR